MIKNNKGSIGLWLILSIFLVGIPLIQLVIGIPMLIFHKHHVNNALEAATTAMSSNTVQEFTDEGDIIEIFDEVKAKEEAYDLFVKNIRINGLSRAITAKQEDFKAEFFVDSNGIKKCRGTLEVNIKFFKILPLVPEEIQYTASVVAKVR